MKDEGEPGHLALERRERIIIEGFDSIATRLRELATGAGRAPTETADDASDSDLTAAGDAFRAAADGLLDVANATLAEFRQSRAEIRRLLDNLDARLETAHGRE